MDSPEENHHLTTLQPFLNIPHGILAPDRTRTPDREHFMQVRRSSMRRPAPAILAALVPLVMGLAACGDDTENSTEGESTPGDGDLSEGEQQLEFYDCMRDNGVDLPDPEPGEGIQLEMDEYSPEAEAALAECEELLPVPPGADAEPDAEGLESLREFVECIREHGYDMPDPEPDGMLRLPEGTDPYSDEWEESLQDCQGLLDGQPLQIGPPHG
jgi:hypothetical protein